MSCDRFKADGMRFLDGEMTSNEREAYQDHVAHCAICEEELSSMGRIVRLTEELRLRDPDDVFWANYWKSVYRRLERGFGFFALAAGLVAVLSYGVYHAVTSPDFFTWKGLGLTAAAVGLVILFVSVARERYYESQSDPYKDVQR